LLRFVTIYIHYITSDVKYGTSGMCGHLPRALLQVRMRLDKGK
jgi:hypothetical protein